MRQDRNTSILKLAIASALLVAIIVTIALHTQEPANCALCGYGKGQLYHAPVLVDLSKGETFEMRVYAPDLTDGLAVAQVQPAGTFYPIRFHDLTGYRATGEQYCCIYMPEKNASLKNKYFCKECRDILREYTGTGYVLADLYDRDEIEVYGISDGAKHNIREDYEVIIQSDSDSNELKISVHGLVEGLTFVDEETIMTEPLSP